ncbi:MAG: hypothetical protein JSR28_10765 [Proteobacteria bacterium]|nr:hypothetical protein [Pseudomonadota bacterium]
MTERRRFFPMRTVQTDPGRTVELAVQVRKGAGPLAAAPVRGPGPGAVLTWLPVFRTPYFSKYYAIQLEDGAREYRMNGDGIVAQFEGDQALQYQEWSDVPSSGGDFTADLPIAHAGWRCTFVEVNLASLGLSALQGVLLGAPSAADITWDLQWSATPYEIDWGHIAVLSESSPGFAVSKIGHTASAVGALLVVVPSVLINGEDTPEETLIATAYADGTRVGSLGVSISNAGY